MALPLINHLTARPVLELLLAQLEFESPYLFLEPCWPVFLWWVGLAAQHEDGGASFQVTLDSEGPDGAVLTVSILRELTDPAPIIGDDDRVSTRQVGIQWTYVLTEAGDLKA
jgi:hypothetical protein